MRRLALALVVFMSCVFHAPLFATAAGLPTILSNEKARPGVEAGPTQVSVAIWIADISRVDSVAQTFSADVIFVVRWRDPSLAHGERRFKRLNLTEIWNPGWLVVNAVGSPTYMLPEVAEVAGDGTVTYRQRMNGTFAQSTDLHAFPFDKGTFRIHFMAISLSPAEIRFVPYQIKASDDLPPGLGMATNLTIQDWRVSNPRALALPYTLASRLEFAGYAVEFQAERLSWHYTAKVILPLLLIVMMSWTAFWLDSSMGGSQITVATSSMLTLIAYRFSVGADVPKIPYLTRLDSFILISSVLIFFTLIEVIVTTTLTFKKKQDLSKKIDHYCRVCFPLTYAVILLGIMIL